MNLGRAGSRPGILGTQSSSAVPPPKASISELVKSTRESSPLRRQDATAATALANPQCCPLSTRNPGCTLMRIHLASSSTVGELADFRTFLCRLFLRPGHRSPGQQIPDGNLCRQHSVYFHRKGRNFSVGPGQSKSGSQSGQRIDAASG